jgi:serine/threonine protein kinase
MRYLDAGTLKDRLQSTSLPLDEINKFSHRWLKPWVSHEWVIHRDIKPSNIMLDRRGTVF